MFHAVGNALASIHLVSVVVVIQLVYSLTMIVIVDRKHWHRLRTPKEKVATIFGNSCYWLKSVYIGLDVIIILTLTSANNIPPTALFVKLWFALIIIGLGDISLALFY